MTSTEEAAQGIALGLESLVGWWKVHGYVGGGLGMEEFRWHFAEPSQVAALRQWCAQNVKDPAAADLAVKQLVARNVLPEKEARARVRDLLGRACYPQRVVGDRTFGATCPKTGRAEIQLGCDYRIKPLETAEVGENELASRK